MEALTIGALIAISLIGGYGVALLQRATLVLEQQPTREQWSHQQQTLNQRLMEMTLQLQMINRQLAEVPAPNNDLPPGVYMPQFPTDDSAMGTLIAAHAASKITAPKY